MDSSIAVLVTVLGTVAAVGVGLATWLSAAKARAEVERDKAIADGRGVAVLAEARGRTLQALATLTARGPVELPREGGGELPAFRSMRGAVVDEDEVNPVLS